VTVPFKCIGADAATAQLLSAFPGGSILFSVELASDPVASPASGAQFDLPLRWSVTFDQGMLGMASGIGITSVDVSDAAFTAGVTAGAAGPDHVAHPGPRTVQLSSASFTEGPFLAPFTRTGQLGDPITVVAKHLALTIKMLSGAFTVPMVCDPTAAASFNLTDVVGETPDPTTSTTPASSSTDATVLGTQTTRSLPRTGAELVWPVVIALILIDLGLLADAQSGAPQRRRRPARRT
jgi:hypothetical protein